MPFRSNQQRKAMYAAASGRGNIGIPKSVAKKFIEHKAHGGIVGYEDGGELVQGPQDPRMQNPQYRASYERYAGMDPDKLQQLAVALPFASQQGQMVRDVIQQHRRNPQEETEVEGYASGGRPPWWNKRGRSPQINADRSGVLESTIPGRTDHIPVTASTGSYVVPADVVSGLGEGNSQAGAKIMAEMLKSGPWGAEVMPMRGGRGIPSAPSGRQDAEMPLKRGGKVRDGGDDKVPILAAGGEYMVSADDVRRIGNGNPKRGADILDRWVVAERNKTAKKMLKLPGPKKK